MRVLLGIGLSLMLVGAGRAADADKAEGTLKDMLKVVKEITTILQTIKDDKTADVALPKLEQAAGKIKDLTTKAKGYKLSKDEEKQLKEKYQKEMQDAFTKLIGASIEAGKNAPNKAQKIKEALDKAK
jgi:hypothetical protein